LFNGDKTGSYTKKLDKLDAKYENNNEIEENVKARTCKKQVA